MTGVEEENVKDLVITFTSSSSFRRMLATETSIATYNIVVNSDDVTFETLKAQLEVASGPSGDLNNFIAMNAANNGITVEITVAEPEIENNLEPREASERLTGTQITGLIIGIFLSIGLVATSVAFIIQMKSTTTASSDSKTDVVDTTTDVVDTTTDVVDTTTTPTNDVIAAADTAVPVSNTV